MLFFCRYQDFVEQHADPEVQAEHGRVKDRYRQCMALGWRQTQANNQVSCACHFVGIMISWTNNVRKGVPKLICQWAR